MAEEPRRPKSTLTLKRALRDSPGAGAGRPRDEPRVVRYSQQPSRPDQVLTGAAALFDHLEQQRAAGGRSIPRAFEEDVPARRAQAARAEVPKQGRKPATNPASKEAPQQSSKSRQQKHRDTWSQKRAAIRSDANAQPRSRRSRTIGLVGIGIAVGVLLSFGSVEAGARMDRRQSTKAMRATLGKVVEHQANFRIMTGRYATWPELEQRGERLEPRHRVLRSSASASHWYLQLSDSANGVICERIFELIDEEGARAPHESCRPERKGF